MSGEQQDILYIQQVRQSLEVHFRWEPFISFLLIPLKVVEVFVLHWVITFKYTTTVVNS